MEWNQHFYLLPFHMIFSHILFPHFSLFSRFASPHCCLEGRAVSFSSLGSSDDERSASSSATMDNRGHLILQWLRCSFFKLDALLFLPYSSFNQADLLSLPPASSPLSTTPSLYLHSPPPPIFFSVIHDLRAANLFFQISFSVVSFHSPAKSSSLSLTLSFFLSRLTAPSLCVKA